MMRNLYERVGVMCNAVSFKQIDARCAYMCRVESDMNLVIRGEICDLVHIIHQARKEPIDKRYPESPYGWEILDAQSNARIPQYISVGLYMFW